MLIRLKTPEMRDIVTPNATQTAFWVTQWVTKCRETAIKKMSAASQKQDVKKRHGRSRISNGSTLLPGVDGRSTWVRRCRDLIELHLDELGGVSQATAAEQALVRRAAVMIVELERMEFEFANAGKASTEALDLYSRVSGNVRRLLESVGWRRSIEIEAVSQHDTRDVARVIMEIFEEAAQLEATEKATEALN